MDDSQCRLVVENSAVSQGAHMQLVHVAWISIQHGSHNSFLLLFVFLPPSTLRLSMFKDQKATRLFLTSMRTSFFKMRYLVTEKAHQTNVLNLHSSSGLKSRGNETNQRPLSFNLPKCSKPQHMRLPKAASREIFLEFDKLPTSDVSRKKTITTAEE